MNIPPEDVSIEFFQKIGYRLRPIAKADGSATGWYLSQPNNQGKNSYKTLNDVWEHWAPRGDQHIRDQRTLSFLMKTYDEAPQELKEQIVSAVEDYSKDPFFCRVESIQLLRRLSGNSPEEVLPRYSNEWLNAIVEIVSQPGGAYGFSASAGLAFGLSERDLGLDTLSSRKLV
ncbi:hypothetical protein [Xanthomonas campestris]|uniref:hypothetical protein n=1 Tax=Xanthomonas campestris TaxID=339 RepID=UPI002AD38E41|nr:hypothetical protein [Xanthomonas campestris]MEA0927454.1 hypothetical protein [Xanthomonas campestris pv. campestris]